MKKGVFLLIGAIFCLITVPVFAGGTGEKKDVKFPVRTIENIYPWGPGTTMSVSQIVAAAMGEELGVSMTVISTPGAAGTKAFMTALNRPADGYTIFDGYVAPLVLQPILGNANWNYKDFKPLNSVASNAFSIACKMDEKRWNTFGGAALVFNKYMNFSV
jgi:tripartite-type tricarboxylate transporter receptor subunit TctC